METGTGGHSKEEVHVGAPGGPAQAMDKDAEQELEMTIMLKEEEAERGEGKKYVQGRPHFECPLDFLACPFSPGPSFSQEALQSPTKQLWLISAPAHFSPESLDGRAIPLWGSQTLKAPQPDGTQKVYSMQPTLEDQGSTCLLVPSGHLDRLACTPSFDGSLSICEKYGDPNGNQTLFPIAARPAPHIPEGLKQRFVPFGARLKRPPPEEAANEPRRKKKKKRDRHRLGYMEEAEEQPLSPKREPAADRGLKVSSGESAACKVKGGTSHKHQKRQKEARNAFCALSPDEQEPWLSSSLEVFSQESLLPGAVEDQSHKKKKKKKKKKVKDAIVGEGELQMELDCMAQSSTALQPPFGGSPETPVAENGSFGAEGLDQRKHKKKRKCEEAAAMALTDLSAVKQKAVEKLQDLGGVEVAPEASLALTGDESTVGIPSHKRKKKKKEKERMEGRRCEQERQTVLLDPGYVKQEPESWPELEVLPGQSLGQAESREHSLEGHKKKKKKKKDKRGPLEEGLVFVQQELK